MGEMIFDICGGLLPGRSLKAVIPGGSSAKILRADERFSGKHKDGTEFDWGIEDIPLDFDGPMAAGSMSGSGGIIVMDDTVDIVQAMANINAFYAHESCGQCTPCREGCLWMRKITKRMCWRSPGGKMPICSCPLPTKSRGVPFARLARLLLGQHRVLYRNSATIS